MSAGVLFANNFKAWIGARGFIMVVVAALVPLILTGAWVVTHQRDLTALDVTWTPEPANVGAAVNFTGTLTNSGRFRTDAFNVTLQVLSTEPDGAGGVVATEKAETTTLLGGLGPGETTSVQLTWTPSASIFNPDVGTFVVFFLVDSDDAIPEIDEVDNLLQKGIQVQPGDLGRDLVTQRPSNITGSPGASSVVDAGIDALTWSPARLFPDNRSTFTATVRNAGPAELTNASVTIQIGTYPRDEQSTLATRSTNVTLGAGQATDVTLEWNATFVGLFWVEATVNVTAQQNDPNATNNARSQVFLVDRELVYEEPPERLTIKQFYVQVIGLLQIRLLIPFIAIFYAAGVLADERERGNLTYILTRPVSRWLLPITKLVAGFSVSAVAVSIGIILTFFLLLGTPHRDVGYLTTPLLISLLSLLVYGCAFLLVSVVVDRPYLAAMAFVAWEWLVQIGEVIEFDGQSVVAPWVKNATLSFHLSNAFSTWEVEKGLQWLPEGNPAIEALRNVVIAALAFVALAAFMMKRREFDV